MAALIGCCVTTGVGAATKTAEVQPGSSVVVIGLGGRRAVVRHGRGDRGRRADRRRRSRRGEAGPRAGDRGDGQVLAGADAPRPLAAIRDLTDGGPDVCFEAIGLPATIEVAIACLPTGGTAVLVGMTPFGVRASFEPFPFVDGGRRILGSNYGSADPPSTSRATPRSTSPGGCRRTGSSRGGSGSTGLEDAFAAMRRGEGVRSVIGF